MLRAILRNPHSIFYAILALYLLAGLINLAQLPVVWTDEVMNLDPAVQWHKTGHYQGFLWPNAGSNVVFLSYPPLIEIWHIAMLYLLPLDVFWMRLPFLLLHVFTALLLYRLLLQVTGKQIQIALLLTLLFIFDKVVFEISRSMRVEVLSVFLVVLLFWLHIFNKSAVWRGVVLGFLLLAHINLWPLVGAYFLHMLFIQKDIKKLAVAGFVSLIPPMLFLLFIDFNIQGLMVQMFQQTGKHTANGGLGGRFVDFVFLRFWPVYREQPWALLYTPLMLAVGIRSLFKARPVNVFAWVFVLVAISWMFILAPHYRYWPPLFVVGLLLFASQVRGFNQALLISRPVWILIILALGTGFIARHYIAFIQREERSPKLAKAWLKEHLDSSQKTLIVGEGIAFYLSLESNFYYGIPFYPQNLHPEQFDEVYYLAKENPGLELVSEYQPPIAAIPSFLRRLQKGETYAGMKLIRIHNTNEWQQLTGKYTKDYAE